MAASRRFRGVLATIEVSRLRDVIERCLSASTRLKFSKCLEDPKGT